MLAARRDLLGDGFEHDLGAAAEMMEPGKGEENAHWTTDARSERRHYPAACPLHAALGPTHNVTGAPVRAATAGPGARRLARATRRRERTSATASFRSECNPARR